ncbi:MAG: MFS transporter [Candidatus Bathyarchaeota archaeon]
MDRKNKPFYGHWILAVSLVSLFISNAAGFYSFGVFFKPVQAEFQWSREVTSVTFLILFLVQAAASPFIGRLTDRHGPKNVMILGVFILGFGLFLTSLTNGLLLFYASYAVNGLGESFLSMIAVGALISKWFVRRRGMAIGISATGIGFSGLVAAPLIGIILIPTFGWRIAYQFVALLSVVLVAIPVQLVVKQGPKDMGLYPDGAKISETEDETKNSSNFSEGWSVSAALKTSTFWLVVSAYFLFQIVVSGTTQHLVNHFTDIGFSVVTATTALSFVGLGSVIGKFSFGVAVISSHQNTPL